MQRPHIANAFEPGARALDPNEGEITVRLETLPDVLVAPTGQIIACNPLYCVDTSPFTISARPGAYPVILCIAQFSGAGQHCIARPGERRIAAAMLCIQSEPAVRWELAICQEEREKQADSEAMETSVEKEVPHYDGAYCVDSGHGSFMDEAAIDAFLARSGASHEEREAAAWDARVDYLLQHMDEDHSQRPARYNIILDEQTGLNLLIFTSGWGDGGYASYWGFDADGIPVCLITDFGIFEEAEWAQEGGAHPQEGL